MVIPKLFICHKTKHYQHIFLVCCITKLSYSYNDLLYDIILQWSYFTLVLYISTLYKSFLDRLSAYYFLYKCLYNHLKATADKYLVGYISFYVNYDWAHTYRYYKVLFYSSKSNKFFDSLLTECYILTYEVF